MSFPLVLECPAGFLSACRGPLHVHLAFDGLCSRCVVARCLVGCLELQLPSGKAFMVVVGQ